VLVVTKANLKPHKNNQILRFFAGICLVNPQNRYFTRPTLHFFLVGIQVIEPALRFST